MIWAFLICNVYFHERRQFFLQWLWKRFCIKQKILLVFIVYYLIFFFRKYSVRVQTLKINKGPMAYKFTILQYESTVSAPTSYDLIADAKGSVDIHLILDH